MADFVFADEYRLQDGNTRRYYEMFLKGLVHKHNNLMGVIQGFSSLILFDEGISGEVRESAQQMQDSAKTASELNREVLVPGGCGRCEKGIVDLGPLLAYWKDKAEELAEGAGVPLTYSPRAGLSSVSGDSSKLSDLVGHLLNNAFEAAKEIPNGSVAVDIFPPGEASQGANVDLFIRNNSSELTREALVNAYIPFETSKGSEHFGIGLTSAAILAGEMGMRLGLRHAEGTTTAWLAMPAAS